MTLASSAPGCDPVDHRVPDDHEHHVAPPRVFFDYYIMCYYIMLFYVIIYVTILLCAIPYYII